MRKVAANNNEYGGVYINSLGTQGLVLEDIVACSNGDAFGDIIPSSGLFAKYSGIVACDNVMILIMPIRSLVACVTQFLNFLMFKLKSGLPTCFNIY